jgi:hypothetical protein
MTSPEDRVSAARKTDGYATMVGFQWRRGFDDGKKEKLPENEQEMSNRISEFMLPCICLTNIRPQGP